VPSLTEVLIIRGIMPIETLDVMSDDPLAEAHIIQMFMDEGRVTPGQIASARAEVMGLSFVELSEYPIDRTAVALVPAALCKRHKVLPIHIAGEMLTLAMVNPDDVFALDDVRAATFKLKREIREPSNPLVTLKHEVDELLTPATVADADEHGHLPLDESCCTWTT